jgi:hypothetical protein
MMQPERFLIRFHASTELRQATGPVLANEGTVEIGIIPSETVRSRSEVRHHVALNGLSVAFSIRCKSAVFIRVTTEHEGGENDDHDQGDLS